MESLLNSGNLVYLAMLVSIAGFVLTNQVHLRVLLLMGSAVYITYYYVHTDLPQWNAMISSAVVASANVYGLVSVLMSRMTWFFTPEQRKLYEAMSGVEPGEFRRLFRAGSLRRNRAEVLLTTQGRQPESIFFIFEGRTRAMKSGSRFEIEPGAFIGEVSFMLGNAASATCTLEPGGLYLEWTREDLSRLLRRQPKLKQAFEAQLARDMAQKVASGVLTDLLTTGTVAEESDVAA